MRQVRIHAPGQFRVDDVAMPMPGRDDALIRVAACGICGSDLGYVKLGGVAGPSGAPMPLGHELSGYVEAVGANVRGLTPGMPVVVNPMAAGNLIGNGGPEGGFAPWLLVRDARLGDGVHAIPDGLPLGVAALTEPLAVAMHAVNRAQVKPDERVVVFGAGPIGLGIVAALRHRGIADVVVVDPSALRLALARRLGADAAINPAEASVSSLLAERHGGGEMFGWPVVETDVYIDASGAPSVIPDVLGMCRRGARLIVVAVHKQPVAVDFRMVLAKEVHITGAIGYPDEFPEALELLAQRGGDLDALISHRFPFADFAQAFAVAEDPAVALKVMVEFQACPT